MQEIKLTKLSIQNFKNYLSLNLSFNSKLICFAGNNGMGKTNILDAIYYTCFCKSFSNNLDVQNIKDNEQYFVIDTEFYFDAKPESFYTAYKLDERKVVKRNKKEYEKLSDHIGLLPLVLMSPADIFLLYDGSEVRRKFIDGIISQTDSNYLHSILQYNKALAQRNSLLKNFAEYRNINQDLLEVWDNQLVIFGTKIFEARSSFSIEFIEIFREYYRMLSPENEVVEFIYQSQLLNQNLTELLTQNFHKDYSATYTTQGIHKDDLLFLLNGKSLKKIASQGQQKTFLTALKLAQYQYILKKKQSKPLLLIDDINDKLDATRVEQLIKIVSSDLFGQVFITDTNPDHILNIFKHIRTPFQLFLVDNGNAKLMEH